MKPNLNINRFTRKRGGEVAQTRAALFHLIRNSDTARIVPDNGYNLWAIQAGMVLLCSPGALIITHTKPAVFNKVLCTHTRTIYDVHGPLINSL